MLDKLKKRSARQQAASRANGARGRGPVTARGKKRSCANALKHGLFARELLIAEQEREQFENLRRALAAELEPDTVLLWIFFDDILALIWRMKTALRLEQVEMGQQLAAADEARSDAAAVTISDFSMGEQRQRIDWLVSLEELTVELKRQQILEMIARSAPDSTQSRASRYEFAVRLQETQRRNLLRMLKEYHTMKTENEEGI